VSASRTRTDFGVCVSNGPSDRSRYKKQSRLKPGLSSLDPSGRQAPNAKRQTPSAKRRAPSAERRAPNAKRQTPNAKRQTPNAKRLTHDPNCMRRFSPVKRLSLSGASPHQVTACSRTNHLSDCVGENHALPCGRSNVTIQFRRNGDPRLPSMIKSRARPRPSPLSPFAS
jgi:hypothetical protein